MPYNPWITTPLCSGAIPANSYPYKITGLTTGTIYEYRAYMVVDALPYYGEICTATTTEPIPTAPIVQTGYAHDLGTTSMKVSGNSITNKGNQSIGEYGVLYTQNPTYGTAANLQYQNLPLHVNKMSISADIAVNDLFFTGTTGSIINLNPNTTTYYRAFGKNNTGCGYGIVKTVQTEPSPPVLELRVSSSAANLGIGTLDFMYGEPNEILHLSFNLTEHVDPSFSSLNFDNPNVYLDVTHQTKNAVITLDSNGAATGNYEFIPNSTYDTSATVTIVSRSIGTLPVTEQSTNVSSN